MKRQIALAPATLVLLLLQGPAAGEQAAWTADFSATLTSDYVFRGVSQTMSSPALQGGIEVAHESGLYASLWASNVDFVASGDPDDGSRVEADFAIGVATSLSDAVAVDLSWIRYAFPGTDTGVDYDYSEWLATLELPRGYALSVGYSNSVFGSGEPGTFYQAAARFGLPLQLEVSLALGHYDLEQAFGDSYRYGSVAVGRPWGNRADWEISLHDTSTAAEELFYSSTARPRVTATLNLYF